MGDPLDEVIKLAQKCIEQVPVIVLGSGASLQYGVGGMADLENHLIKNIKPNQKSHKEIWESFLKALAKSKDLEAALHEVHLPDDLELLVIQQTRQLVLKDDQEVFQKLITRDIDFSLVTLLHHLLNTVHKKISIVTTNYDRLAEYAIDVAGYSHSTGFARGYFRSFNSKLFSKNHSASEQTVEVLKVHGSVDWFLDEDGAAICLPDIVSPPENFKPLLVTPGTGKYLATHNEPFRSIMTRSDEAFANARSIFCIGYGFNDQHIHPKLTNRVYRDKVPIVILARTLKPTARDFLSKCKHGLFLALEKSETGTKAYTSNNPQGIDLPVGDLWELKNFLQKTIGNEN